MVHSCSQCFRTLKTYALQRFKNDIQKWRNDSNIIISTNTNPKKRSSPCEIRIAPQPSQPRIWHSGCSCRTNFYTFFPRPLPTHTSILALLGKIKSQMESILTWRATACLILIFGRHMIWFWGYVPTKDLLWICIMMHLMTDW